METLRHPRRQSTRTDYSLFGVSATEKASASRSAMTRLVVIPNAASGSLRCMGDQRFMRPHMRNMIGRSHRFFEMRAKGEWLAAISSGEHRIAAEALIRTAWNGEGRRIAMLQRRHVGRDGDGGGREARTQSTRFHSGAAICARSISRLASKPEWTIMLTRCSSVLVSENPSYQCQSGIFALFVLNFWSAESGRVVSSFR
ncbi:hypothetical protein VTK26DRAFT_8103 [Humicola hyalothermophila]